MSTSLPRWALEAPRPGATTVRTTPFELTQRFGEQVLSFAGILLLQGPAGTGKTFAAKTMCSGLDVPIAFLHLADTARGHAVLRVYLDELGEPSEATGRVLLQRAREALAGRRLVVFVDEAHLLNQEALRQIRYLFDHRDAVRARHDGGGLHGCLRARPELESRVSRRVTFAPLMGPELLRSLTAFHPILKATDVAILTDLDRRLCKGVWRTWDMVVRDAIGYGDTASTGVTRRERGHDHRVDQGRVIMASITRVVDPVDPQAARWATALSDPAIGEFVAIIVPPALPSLPALLGENRRCPRQAGRHQPPSHTGRRAARADPSLAARASHRPPHPRPCGLAHPVHRAGGEHVRRPRRCRTCLHRPGRRGRGPIRPLGVA